MQIQAAAVSLADRKFMVVFAGLELIGDPGEADMTIDTLVPAFGGTPVVLMGQHEDGTPSYYGEQDLVELLRGVPVEKMPWKEYSVG